MSVRRPQASCILCRASLDSERHRAICYAYQEAPDLFEACARLEALGLSVAPDALRRHFQYHRPQQPPPRKRMRSAKALARAQGMPLRLRRAMTLSARLPALSGSQLAEFLYWNGRMTQYASARAACYRDLSRLVKNSFLYRYYPPLASGPSSSRVRSWQHRLSFYFLGRNGVAYVEQTLGRTLQRGRDWIVDENDLPPLWRLLSLAATNEAFALLSRQALRAQAANSPLPGGQGLVTAAFGVFNASSLSTLDGSRLSQPLEELILASYGLRVEATGTAFEAPFLLAYDDGLSGLAEAVERVMEICRLRREGSIAEKLPAIASRGVFPPTLFISSDPYRLEAVRREAQREARRKGLTINLPIVVSASIETLKSGAWEREVWVSLWDVSPAPRGHYLSDVLLHPWREHSDPLPFGRSIFASPPTPRATDASAAGRPREALRIEDRFTVDTEETRDV
jgi:hypothetical protein